MREARGASHGALPGAPSRSDDHVDLGIVGVSPLRLPNLLNDADTLAELLSAQADAGEWLDAFLLAAGLDQIFEDALHRLPLSLDRISARLQREAGGWLGRGAGNAAGWARTGVWTLRAQQAPSSALALAQEQAETLAAELAELVIGDVAGPGATAARREANPAPPAQRLPQPRYASRGREGPDG
jgi:hypothetical protein